MVCDEEDSQFAKTTEWELNEEVIVFFPFLQNEEHSRINRTAGKPDDVRARVLEIYIDICDAFDAI